MPKVSVIVPNYNHSQYLTQRIESILNQTYQDFELILLDDCSTDNSREIIESFRYYPKVKHVLYNEINGGTSYKQWYKGIQLAKGELIWIAESDDWCDLRFLECLEPHFEDSEVSIVYCKSLNVNKSDRIYQIPDLTNQFTKYDGNDYIGKFMLTGNGIRNGSMVIFKREKYLQLLSTRWKDLLLAGDWLLWVEMANKSKIVEVDDTLNYFRVYEGSASSRFNKLGLFLIEGLEVVKRAISLTKGDYSKFKLYKIWTNLYFIYSDYFIKGVAIKVLKEFVKFDYLFLFIFLYRFPRNQIKKIYYSIFK